jgi:hypothetical protein
MAFLFKSSNKSKSQRNGFAPTSGVGIVFKSGPDEALFVKSITEGGPASASNPPIRVNDCLLKVDGDDVYRMPINKVVEYIMGEGDSPIQLTFQRFAGNKLETFQVSLRRGRAATIRASHLDSQDALEQHDPQHHKGPESYEQQEDDAKTQLALKEEQASVQARLSERLEKMKELKDFEALSFTGKASKDDPTGIYEGDLDAVRHPSPSPSTAPGRSPRPHARRLTRAPRRGASGTATAS